MRFPVVFSRQKGGAAPPPVLGSDADPTVANPQVQPNNKGQATDCQGSFKIRDINGWPVQRIAVCWTTTAGAPTPLNADLYVWEQSTAHWYRVNPMTLAMLPNQLYFFDIVSIAESPASGAQLQAGAAGAAGPIDCFLRITDPGGQVAGTFNIAYGPDITTVGT